MVYRILPALTSEFVNLDMVPFVLPNVLLIAEECTKEEYCRLILPDLTPVFKQQEPIQVQSRSGCMLELSMCLKWKCFARGEVWFRSLKPSFPLLAHFSFKMCHSHFWLTLYQNVCIFLFMPLQASNMVSGFCSFTSSSLSQHCL